MTTRHFRVTYRSDDRLGRVDFVRDVRAETLSHAIAQAQWLLEAAHPQDHQAYRPAMAVEIDRERYVARKKSVPS